MILLRDNLADLTSYGLLGVGLLILGFLGLDLVTPGSLRNLIWRDGNRNAVILAVAQLAGLALAIGAAVAVSNPLTLWRGCLYVFVYGVVTIALMMFSFVLVDLLTPGPLGTLLLREETVTVAAANDEDETVEVVEVLAATRTPAVWVSAGVFVAIGLFVAAALFF